jgi:C1A family cysteine protease
MAARLRLTAALLLAAVPLFSLLALADPQQTGAAVDSVELTIERAQADLRGTFSTWAAKYGRTYLDDPQETEQRFRNWLATLEHVLEHSRKQSTMRLHLGASADMTDEEFRAAYLGQKSNGNPMLRAAKQLAPEQFRYRHDTELPEEVDWRKAGIVGPIKNQHMGGAPCGCCWTFATTGIAECINAMYTGEVVSLSEQQLISCDHAKPYEDAGCEGGDFGGGLHYIIAHGGINTEADYPYIAHDAPCNKTLEARKVVTLDAWEVVPPGNESALMQAVARHPVAVGVCVGPYIKNWRAYKGGIFDGGSCETPIDHAMVVVGYGSEDGRDYWLVKNSWNTEFGEEGYMKFPRDASKLGFGYASIAHEPAFPIKTSPNPPTPAMQQRLQRALGRGAGAATAATAEA